MGDKVKFINKESLKQFGVGKILKVVEKPLGKLTKEDRKGHEKFSNDSEMYETYSKYYGREVNSSTTVKIVWFKLL